MEEIELNPTDRTILDELNEGRCSPAYIAEESGYSRQNITNRLGRLVEHGYVEKLHAGLYELINDPRKDGETMYLKVADPSRDIYYKIPDSGHGAQQYVGEGEEWEPVTGTELVEHLAHDAVVSGVEKVSGEVTPFCEGVSNA